MYLSYFQLISDGLSSVPAAASLHLAVMLSDHPVLVIRHTGCALINRSFGPGVIGTLFNKIPDRLVLKFRCLFGIFSLFLRDLLVFTQVNAPPGNRLLVLYPFPPGINILFHCCCSA